MAIQCILNSPMTSACLDRRTGLRSWGRCRKVLAAALSCKASPAALSTAAELITRLNVPFFSVAELLEQEHAVAQKKMPV